MRKLAKEEKSALKAVKGGADVYDYGIAKALRRLEKLGLVRIVKLQGDFTGVERMPYFGAIAL